MFRARPQGQLKFRIDAQTATPFTVANTGMPTVQFGMAQNNGAVYIKVSK